jgi:hypothetical protein
MLMLVPFPLIMFTRRLNFQLFLYFIHLTKVLRSNLSGKENREIRTQCNPILGQFTVIYVFNTKLARDSHHESEQDELIVS